MFIRIVLLFVRALLVAALLATCAVGGMALGLLVAGSTTEHTSFATLETRVRPELDGHVRVYVPLVDWRVELLDHSAPASVEIDVRGINRGRAQAGISSAAAASTSVQELRRDSRQVVQHAVRRGAIVAGIGGIVGASIGGALLAGLLLRRRWLLIGPLVGVGVVALVLVPSVAAMRDLGAQQVTVTAAGGNADELPTVLRFASQLLDVGDEYEHHYETALDSISNLAAFADGDEGDGDGDRVAPTSSALVVSDLHDNVFVLDALDEFAGGSTVFAVGDFVQVGARVEERLARRVARLGDRVVAVSGNHDTPEFMDSLADAGADVLTRAEPRTTFGGLRVAGYPDPLERLPESEGEHRLRVYGAEYVRQREDFLDWWDELAAQERPDVLLVHQHGFAHALVEHLVKEGDTEPLVVLTGHDHDPHVHAEGPHVIVDAGTVGAGGLAAVGEQEASFARLDLVGDRVVAVDLVSIEPLTGRASTERVPIPAAAQATSSK